MSQLTEVPLEKDVGGRLCHLESMMGEHRCRRIEKYVHFLFEVVGGVLGRGVPKGENNRITRNPTEELTAREPTHKHLLRKDMLCWKNAVDFRHSPNKVYVIFVLHRNVSVWLPTSRWLFHNQRCRADREGTFQLLEELRILVLQYSRNLKDGGEVLWEVTGQLVEVSKVIQMLEEVSMS